MPSFLNRSIARIEQAPLTLATFAATLLGIIAVRIGLENFLENIPFRFADEFFYQFSHHFLTFGTIFLLSLPVARFAGKTDIRQAANVLLFGFLIIWTPPIVDEIISRGAGLWSFYAFDSLQGLIGRFFTFFGDRPDVGITYGVRLEVALVVIFIGLYAWVKSRSLWHSLLSAFALYAVLFLMGALPSLVTVLVLGTNLGFLSIGEHDIARFMLSPEPLFILNPPALQSVLAIKMSLVYAPLFAFIVASLLLTFHRSTFFALVHNSRFPQLAYHAGLFLIGALLTFVYGTAAFEADFFHVAATFTLLLAVECAWLASVVMNDFRDINIDRLTNPNRPLITGSIDPTTYQTIGWLFFAFSLFFSAIVSTQATLLLLAYQALAFLYSSDPLRLKRFPLVATALAASASLLVFFAGFIVFSAEKNISALPEFLPAFLFFAYLAIIPVKDFKDIAGDQADGVFTLPVLLGEERGKRVIGSLVFLAFVTSPLVFSLRSLFPLALFFGALGYWLLQRASAKHPHFSYHRLAGWYMLLAFSYGVFVVLTFLRQ